MSFISKHFHIGGMSWINCQNKIYKGLRSAPGIKEAAVSYRSGTAKITYDPKITNVDQIAKVIENLDTNC